jgi:hypothetical protein
MKVIVLTALLDSLPGFIFVGNFYTRRIQLCSTTFDDCYHSRQITLLEFSFFFEDAEFPLDPQGISVN